MKKILQQYAIIGLVIILVAGFAPLSPTDELAVSQEEFDVFMESLSIENSLPIETGLPPLKNIRDTFNIEDREFVEENIESDLKTTIVEFDLNSRNQKITSKDEYGKMDIDFDSTLFQPQEGISHTYSGHLGELMAEAESDASDSMLDGIRPTWIFGSDDRSLVPDATLYPFSSVVSIHVPAIGGGYYMGSGAIIDEYHVLTCAHIVYIQENGGWPSSMEIVPARDYSTEPFGIGTPAILRVPGEWIASEDYRHDWALITLNEPLGNLTGWMGVATYDEDDPVYSNTLYTAGYPGDLNSGWRMYNTTDLGKGADYYNHDFALDTAGGQSGSAIWTKNATGEFITTILAYEIDGGLGWNFGTRINDDLYYLLGLYITIDSDPTPKSELRNVYADTTAGAWSEVYKKNTLFSIFTDVENLGSLVTGEVAVNFYLSEDDTITSADYLLGTESVSSIGILESVSMDWSGTVGKEVPTGRYYMGWIIDPENAIAEYNENDNSGTVGTIRIIVKSTPLQEFLWSPLGMGVMIGGGAVIVLVPTIAITVSVRKRRKRTNAGVSEEYYSGYF